MGLKAKKYGKNGYNHGKNYDDELYKLEYKL